MTDEVELISDGDGLAVIGEQAMVEQFLEDAGLASSARRLDLARLTPRLGSGSAVAQAGSELAANSGRWLKLTEESAARVKQYGLMPGKERGVTHAMVGKPGEVKHWLQVAKGPGSVATNPAVLAGAAGIMAQLAMQTTMDEITDYLARIDQKLDDVLRAQEDAVWADLIGVGFDVDEAMTLREHGGRVNEVTWSKVEDASSTIGKTQAYALRQIDALADKVERQSGIGDLADAAKEAEAKVQGWLAVLARCFELLDAVAVLELDRVLDVAPGDLDGHRLGLRAAREKRLTAIERCTDGLLARLDAAAAKANLKVLRHPSNSPAVVAARAQVVTAVAEFHEPLGIVSGRESLEARRWREAAAEVRDRARAGGAEGVDAVRRAGGETFGRAKSVTGRMSGRLAARVSRRREDHENAVDDRLSGNGEPPLGPIE